MTQPSLDHSTASLAEGYIAIHEKTRELRERDHPSVEYENPEDDPTYPRRLLLESRRASLLSDLQQRLMTAQIPEQLEESGWDYGTERHVLKDLAREWLHDFDWEEELATLNDDFDHWTCEIDGINIHYVRYDPWAEENATSASGEIRENPFAGKTHKMANKQGEVILPLLLIHGWPGSWYEFAKVIKLLQKRGRFQIIAPSLPGFGWSDAPKTKGWGVRRMAETLHKLMQRLGYTHYAAQGGDWGSLISRALATLYPDNCLAIHINMLPCLPPRPLDQPLGFLQAIAGFVLPGVFYRNDSRAQESLRGLLHYARREAGYFLLQSTKPQTLGYALQDSPMGLLAWLSEKYLSWADCDPLDKQTWPFTSKELLTQIMIYHSTDSITSSMRIYYETYTNRDTDWLLRQVVPASVPVGIGIWKKELFMVPRHWAESYLNVVSWREFPKGGHFAAFERPEEFEQELVSFFTREEVLDAFTAKRMGWEI
ncbi:hypothetical protein BGZ73_004060 [Actinomortierella ambigua]|nr:hypothetical protein BGZ73_004060 [Actinomortierella ambigua]